MLLQWLLQYCVFEERNKESAEKTIACYGATRHSVIETGADFKLFLNHREFVLIEFRFVSHLPFAFLFCEQKQGVKRTV